MTMGKDQRSRSQAILDDRLLVDFPQDAYWHMIQNHLSFCNIRNVIFTHSHQDHLYADDFGMRSKVYAKNITEPVHVWGNETVIEKIRAAQEIDIPGRVEAHVFEEYKPDVVLYDVLGDVVCGGFAAPIREGYAEKVLIVTSGEKMALYAANNIKTAVDNFEDRGYASVGGIILNRRNVENEREKVESFAKEHGLEIVADIPRSSDITRFEDQGMTVIEGDPDLEISRIYMDLASRLLESGDGAESAEN